MAHTDRARWPLARWTKGRPGIAALVLGVLNGCGFFGVFYALGPRDHVTALVLAALAVGVAVGLVAYVGERRRTRRNLRSPAG